MAFNIFCLSFGGNYFGKVDVRGREGVWDGDLDFWFFKCFNLMMLYLLMIVTVWRDEGRQTVVGLKGRARIFHFSFFGS